MLSVRPRALEGTFEAPASKSVTHRALLLAAQSPDPCRVSHWLDADDPRASLDAMRAFGTRIEQDGDDLILSSRALSPPKEVDCRNAGTTLRFMLGLAARFETPVRLSGDASLQGRPNGALIAALRSGGARIDGDEFAPLTVQGPIRPGAYALPAKTSSQFASSLMLNLPFLRDGSDLELAPPVSSAPYLRLTSKVAAAFGVETAPGHIPGGQVVRCRDYTVEGDWSGAAFPLVGAAISGGKVRLTGLDPDSEQGDKAILAHLHAFGAQVNGATVEGGHQLNSPGVVDVQATPDMFPALCILAACARGTTEFTGGAALRHKESDRISAMATGLTQLGIRCSERPDGLLVEGGRIETGTVDARGDHRIHMAFAIAGLAAAGPIQVTDPEAAAISYPGFHQIFKVPA